MESLNVSRYQILIRACEAAFLDNGLKWKETIKIEENTAIVFESWWTVSYITLFIFSSALGGR